MIYDEVSKIDYRLLMDQPWNKSEFTDFFTRPLWLDYHQMLGTIVNQRLKFLLNRDAGKLFERYMLFFEGHANKIDKDQLENEIRDWLASKNIQDASTKNGNSKKSPFPIDSDAEDDGTKKQSNGDSQKTKEPEHPPKNEYATSKGAGMSDVDLLGRERLINALTAMIASDKQDTPFTIGLLGDWGSGKSNLMHLVKKKLKERTDHERFYFADFNAWEYEHTDNMTAGVAQEVLGGFFEEMNIFKKLWVRLRFGFMENGIGTTIIILLLVFLAVLSGVQLILNRAEISLDESWLYVLGASLALLAGFTKRIFTILEHPLTAKINNYLRLPNYLHHLGTIPILKQQLRNLCKIIIPEKAENPSRLVVFVDDLDRCEHHAISRTLDAIRLVMDIRNVVVIIGIDHRIAFRAIEMQYSDLADDIRTSSDIARDYLGKIIQLPIQLPKPVLAGFIEGELFNVATQAKTEPAPTPGAGQTGNSGQSPATGKDTSPSQTGASQETDKPNPESGKKPDKPPTPPEGTAPIPPLPLPVDLVEMVETASEVQDFKELVRLFGFDNPRQLTRLRNCYRLLKGFDPETAYRDMLILFWFEYVFSLRQEARDEMTGKNNLPDVSKMTDSDPIKTELMKAFADEAEYIAYLRKISYVVLPHSESAKRAKREETADQEPGEMPTKSAPPA